MHSDILADATKRNAPFFVRYLATLWNAVDAHMAGDLAIIYDALTPKGTPLQETDVGRESGTVSRLPITRRFFGFMSCHDGTELHFRDSDLRNAFCLELRVGDRATFTRSQTNKPLDDAVDIVVDDKHLRDQAKMVVRVPE